VTRGGGGGGDGGGGYATTIIIYAVSYKHTAVNFDFSLKQ
jgi:hypothetical protein